MSLELARTRCPFYSRINSRQEATDAVNEFLGGDYPNDNNEPFYSAFKEAWGKATTLGLDDLKPLVRGTVKKADIALALLLNLVHKSSLSICCFCSMVHDLCIMTLA